VFTSPPPHAAPAPLRLGRRLLRRLLRDPVPGRAGRERRLLRLHGPDRPPVRPRPLRLPRTPTGRPLHPRRLRLRLRHRVRRRGHRVPLRNLLLRRRPRPEVLRAGTVPASRHVRPARDRGGRRRVGPGTRGPARPPLRPLAGRDRRRARPRRSRPGVLDLAGRRPLLRRPPQQLRRLAALRRRLRHHSPLHLPPPNPAAPGRPRQRHPVDRLLDRRRPLLRPHSSDAAGHRPLRLLPVPALAPSHGTEV
ncbi:MAG: Carotenoid biosynthesis protein, partial [uncultured Rubrobacteraceae bacterium]